MYGPLPSELIKLNHLIKQKVLLNRYLGKCLQLACVLAVH